MPRESYLADVEQQLYARWVARVLGGQLRNVSANPATKTDTAARCEDAK